MYRIRFELIDALRQHPRWYLPIARRFRPYQVDGSERAIAPDTELVIEGFPRCGNSFARLALLRAQKRPVKVAHHLHAPAQIMMAARWRIPAMVLIRRPDDAVVSLMLRAPILTFRQGFASFVRFYRKIEPLREHYVLARFESVTSDFGSVVAVINRRFGTDFVEFDHTPENERRCLEAVETEQKLMSVRYQHQWELAVSRPSKVRDRRKDVLCRQLENESLRRSRAAANDLYQHLVTLADV